MKQFLQFISLFLPIFLFTESYLSPTSHRLLASTDYLEASQPFKITIVGVNPEKPTKSELSYLDQTLFRFLNDALNGRKIQISKISLDANKVKLEVLDDSTKFTVLTAAQMQRRKGEALQDLENAVFEEEGEEKRKLVGSSKNRLTLEVTIEGRDYSNVQGRFRSSVKNAINIGRKGLVQEFVLAASSPDYFEHISWIDAMPIDMEVDEGRSFEDTKNDYEAEQRDPADLFPKDETKQDTTKYGTGASGTSSTSSSETTPSKPTYTSTGTKSSDSSYYGTTSSTKEDVDEKPISKKPMNHKAKQFRTIAGSIFISLCITIVLINTLRVANRTREARQKRLAKAKQAYEGPKQPVPTKRTSERFVGMLDDGAIPTR